jgi:hypothetical protein
MTGWVDIIDNLQLHYEAQGEVTCQGPRMTTEGEVIEDQIVSSAAVLSYLKTAFRDDLVILEVKEQSVIVKVTGVVVGTYGSRSYFTTEKVEPPPQKVKPTTETVQPTTEKVEPTTETVEPTTEKVEPTK